MCVMHQYCRKQSISAKHRISDASSEKEEHSKSECRVSGGEPPFSMVHISTLAGLSGSLIPVAEVQEQGQEQGPSRSPRYMPTDVVQSRRRSTMQARKSTGQGRIRTKSKPASVKEDLLLQPDSPV